jgi:hypothetical protein
VQVKVAEYFREKNQPTPTAASSTSGVGGGSDEGGGACEDSGEGEDDGGSRDEDDGPQIRLVGDHEVASRDAVVGIWRDLSRNYYVTFSWTATLYCNLAYHGFISVAEMADNPLLIPEMQKEYCVLQFSDLHISTVAVYSILRRFLQRNAFDATRTVSKL